MRETKRYTVTAALPYANGPLHIGHFAGAYLPADVYARYLRSCGIDVVFVCGSDEHGAAITMRAQKEGVTPREVVDRYHEMMRGTFERFSVSFDVYHRTSDRLHHETAAEFFKELHAGGHLEERRCEQHYDESARAFLPDRYVVGTCPKCGSDRANGDQCESCGSSLDPTDLLDPRSALTGTPTCLRETSHWFLPLDRWQERIEAYVDSHPEWKPSVLGQCRSWLASGLQARSITRDMDWGVRVPIEGCDGKVLYVWFDAPIGYISATKAWAIAKGDPDAWRPYWQSEDTKLVHFIGKDNIVFHCVIFPAMLMAHGGYVLPESVPANEFLNLDGDKMSTSRNRAVWLHEYAEEFRGELDTDVLRYVLASIMPEAKDSNFSWTDLRSRNNGELCATLGNFFNRVVTLTHKFCNGEVPGGQVDAKTMTEAESLLHAYCASVEGYRFKEALSAAMDVARLGNRFLSASAPWKVAKEDASAARESINTAAQLAALACAMFEPFMPKFAARATAMLGLDEPLTIECFLMFGMSLIRGGTPVGPPEILFTVMEEGNKTTKI